MARGMPVYAFNSMLASLRITDTPVGYQPPVGPPVFTTLTYHQKESDQPSTFNFYNLSQKWTINWLTYIQDDPATAGANVLRYQAGGGGTTYSGYSSSTGAFTPEREKAAVLVRTSASPITYELRLADGSKSVFSASNGATSYPRRIFLKTMTDAQGNSLTLNYDSQMRLTSIVDTIGQSTTFSYTNSNPLLVTKITDPFGRSATIGYDASGRLSSITDVIGMNSTFGYDSGTFIQSMTTPYGTTTFLQQQVSTTQYWIQATDPTGHTERTEFRHTAPGISYSDPTAPSGMGITNAYLNYRNSFYWDKEVFASACTGTGTATTCDYTKARIKHFMHLSTATSTTSGVLESIKYPMESRIWYRYPGQTDPLYTGSLDRPTQVGRVTDAGATKVTKYTYNAQGMVLTEIDPVGRESHYTYASNGIDLLTITQKNGSTYDTVAQYTYNSQHRPLTYVDAAGHTTSYQYNSRGQITVITGGPKDTIEYHYNPNGYLLYVSNAIGNDILRFTYDAYGRIATSAKYGFTTTLAYDALDRVISETFPDGTSRVYTWDRLDLKKHRDRELKLTTYSYDALRNLVSVTDPMNQIESYTYYANGNLRTQTDKNGNVTTWDRDLEGRPTKKTFANSSYTSYIYDGIDRLWKVTDALGQTKTYSYALDNRQTAISYSGAVNATAGVSYTYDPYYPQLVSMTDGIGTSEFSYAPVGSPGALKLDSASGPFGLNDSVAYGYDTYGRLTSITTNQVQTFDYDGIGRPIGDQNPLGFFQNSYDGDSDQLLYRLLPIGGGGHYVAYTYDGDTGDRQLQTLSYRGNLALLASRKFTLTHSAEHRLLTKADYNKTTGLTRNESYTYDDNGRLTFQDTASSTALDDSYTYDAANNLTSYTSSSVTVSTTVNNLNQLATVNSSTWTYDANGNLLNDGAFTYLWDAEDRLISATNISNGHVTGFKYDGLGRRLVVSEKNSGRTATETRYTWCGQRICQASNQSNVVIANYFDQGELHGATKLYYIKDTIGSVVGVMDITGSLLGGALYEAYGNLKIGTGTTTDFRFAGMLFNEATGLYLANYRVYKPSVGRWISRDPIEEIAGPNLYAYVGGNPINYIDPYGLYCLSADTIAAIEGSLGGLLTGVIYGGVNGGLAGAAVGGLTGLATGLIATSFAVTLGNNVGSAGVGAGLTSAVGGESPRGVAGGVAGAVASVAIANGAQALFGSSLGAAPGAGAIGGLVGGAVAGDPRLAVAGAIGGGVAGALGDALRGGNDCGCGK